MASFGNFFAYEAL